VFPPMLWYKRLRIPARLSRLLVFPFCFPLVSAPAGVSVFSPEAAHTRLGVPPLRFFFLAETVVSFLLRDKPPAKSFTRPYRFFFL